MNPKFEQVPIGSVELEKLNKKLQYYCILGLYGRVCYFPDEIKDDKHVTHVLLPSSTVDAEDAEKMIRKVLEPFNTDEEPDLSDALFNVYPYEMKQICLLLASSLSGKTGEKEYKIPERGGIWDKDLSEITEEDAIGLVKLWMRSPDYPLTDYSVSRLNNSVEVNINNSHFNETFMIGISSAALWCITDSLNYKVRIELYQYLQSKGYKLPKYY